MASGKKFYLDKSDAKLWGVCSGIADYTGIDALWVRVATVLLTLGGFGFVLLAYIAIAFLANPRPGYLYDDADEDRMLRREYRKRARKAGKPDRLRDDLSDIDRRVAEIESTYSAKSSRLAAEIESLR